MKTIQTILNVTEEAGFLVEIFYRDEEGTIYSDYDTVTAAELQKELNGTPISLLIEHHEAAERNAIESAYTAALKSTKKEANTEEANTDSKGNTEENKPVLNSSVKSWVKVGYPDYNNYDAVVGHTYEWLELTGTEIENLHDSDDIVIAQIQDEREAS